MTALTRKVCLAAMATLLFLACDHPSRTDSEEVRVAIEQRLEPLEGSRLQVSLIEVTYPPGGFSTPHRHTCPVIGYVTSGSLRFQVEGTSDTIYQAGHGFYEAAGERHTVSANASDSHPVTFLAYFVCDDDGPRTIAAGDSGERGGE